MKRLPVLSFLVLMASMAFLSCEDDYDDLREVLKFHWRIGVTQKHTIFLFSDNQQVKQLKQNSIT